MEEKECDVGEMTRDGAGDILITIDTYHRDKVYRCQQKVKNFIKGHCSKSVSKCVMKCAMEGDVKNGIGLFLAHIFFH